jgi:hypothetical protein
VGQAPYASGKEDRADDDKDDLDQKDGGIERRAVGSAQRRAEGEKAGQGHPAESESTHLLNSSRRSPVGEARIFVDNTDAALISINERPGKGIGVGDSAVRRIANAPPRPPSGPSRPSRVA